MQLQGFDCLYHGSKQFRGSPAACFTYVLLSPKFGGEPVATITQEIVTREVDYTFHKKASKALRRRIQSEYTPHAINAAGIKHFDSPMPNRPLDSEHGKLIHYHTICL